MTGKIQRPYVPPLYRAGDAETRDLVRAYPLATIMTSRRGTMEATQTPLFFESDADDCSTVIGHIARINPQAEDVMEPGPMLAVFNGPSAYVSPEWYVEDEDVPTWIYQAVHLRGEIEPVGGADMRSLMEDIVRLSERRIGGTWRLDRISEADIARMMPRIVGFRVHIEALTGISKMEQTRSVRNRKGVAGALERGREIGRDVLAGLLSKSV